MSEETIKLIVFLIVAAVVGFFKLLGKLQESRPQSPRPSAPRPRTPQRPTLQANSEEVRKFLEQLSRQREESKPPPVIAGTPAPVVTSRPYAPRAEPPRPVPATRPPTTFQEHVESDEGEDAVAVEAKELL